MPLVIYFLKVESALKDCICNSVHETFFVDSTGSSLASMNTLQQAVMPKEFSSVSYYFSGIY
jgi:hypothetical protein